MSVDTKAAVGRLMRFLGVEGVTGQEAKIGKEVQAALKGAGVPAKAMRFDDANSRILMMDDADTIRRKFKRAVTDSGTEIRFDESRPAIYNLLEIYHLMTGKSQQEVEAHFAGKGYAQLKGDLAEATIEFLRPIQQRVHEITDEQLDALLERGRAKASAIASATLADVYKRLGISR